MLDSSQLEALILDILYDELSVDYGETVGGKRRAAQLIVRALIEEGMVPVASNG